MAAGISCWPRRYAILPLLCSRCGGEADIIARITAPPTVYTARTDLNYGGNYLYLHLT